MTLKQVFLKKKKYCERQSRTETHQVHPASILVAFKWHILVFLVTDVKALFKLCGAGICVNIEKMSPLLTLRFGT